MVGVKSSSSRAGVTGVSPVQLCVTDSGTVKEARTRHRQSVVSVTKLGTSAKVI